MADKRKGILILFLISFGVVLFFLLSEKNNPVIPLAKKSSALVSEVSPLERIDVNICSVEELESLPGIGEKLSNRIVDYREKSGGFKSIDEVKNIQGINSVWNNIAPYLFVDTIPEKNNNSTGKYKNQVKEASIPIKKEDLNSVTEYSLIEKDILPTDLVHRLIKYRNACNGFKSFDHVAKTHGLTPVFLNRLKEHYYIASFPKDIKKQIKAVDINQADSATLDQLPGLGPVLSVRIIKYRTKLGFFHSLDQLKEVYNLKPEFIDKALPYLYIGKDLSFYPHLDINHANAEQIQSHPYLKDWKKVRAIIRHRKITPFISWQDLYTVTELDSVTVIKIAPYLEFR